MGVAVISAYSHQNKEIHHSHHPKHLIERGHEFRIGNKYFYTGCYGLLIGTVCAVIIVALLPLRQSTLSVFRTVFTNLDP